MIWWTPELSRYRWGLNVTVLKNLWGVRLTWWRSPDEANVSCGVMLHDPAIRGRTGERLNRGSVSLDLYRDAPTGADYVWRWERRLPLPQCRALVDHDGASYPCIRHWGHRAGHDIVVNGEMVIWWMRDGVTVAR